MPTSRTSPRWFLCIVVIILALFVSAAVAAEYVRIAASPDLAFAVDDGGEDAKAVSKVGIDLVYDGALTVLLTPKGAGALGDAEVDCYDPERLPKDALGDVIADRAACWVCVAKFYPGGVTFPIDTEDVTGLIAKTIGRLGEIGFEVTDFAPGSREFSFGRDGVSYRAVFGLDEDGALVYLGR